MTNRNFEFNDIDKDLEERRNIPKSYTSGTDNLSCIWQNFEEFWFSMLFNFVLYLAFFTSLDSSVTNESYVNETRVWR